jgi:hypothetical protein
MKNFHLLHDGGLAGITRTQHQHLHVVPEIKKENVAQDFYISNFSLALRSAPPRGS